MTSRALKGVFRSLRLYQGPDAPRARMDALYARFLSAGDLAFDIGAHVGDRVSSFRRLGARVVALEPQPLAMRALRLIHGQDAAVSLIPAAAAARSGSLQLKINTANPTVSTASAHFIADADGLPVAGDIEDAEARIGASGLVASSIATLLQALPGQPSPLFEVHIGEGPYFQLIGFTAAKGSYVVGLTRSAPLSPRQAHAIRLACRHAFGESLSGPSATGRQA